MKQENKVKNPIPLTTILCPNCDGTKIDPETGNKCKDCNGVGVIQAIIQKKTQLPKII